MSANGRGSRKLQRAALFTCRLQDWPPHWGHAAPGRRRPPQPCGLCPTRLCQQRVPTPGDGCALRLEVVVQDGETRFLPH